MNRHAFQHEKTLREQEARDLTRIRYIIQDRDEMQIVIQGKSVINFCSNDYLSIATHPKVKKAFSEGAQRYGLGSGASSFISGFYGSHEALETAFCKFLNRDRALLFNSGYHANLGVITAFARRNTVVIADKHCHASLIDGIILSRSKYYRYRHNDVSHAEELLRRHAGKDLLLVTESIFSMDGHIANLAKLSELAATYNAMLIVDDAHGVGILGANGSGASEFHNLTQKNIPCLITPLGKSLGSVGAIVSGSDTLIETLMQLARTYCYTTALPPALSYASLEALNVIKNEPWRREQLSRLVQQFILGANARKIPLISSDPTPIKSILVGSNSAALMIQATLLSKGYLVSCIRPPTVPLHTARIRISLNCLHSEEQIVQLLDYLQEYLSKTPQRGVLLK